MPSAGQRSHEEAPATSEGIAASSGAKEHRRRPRTFEEVRAGNLAHPLHAAHITRLDSGERFDDRTAVSDDPFVREVSVHPDCEGAMAC